MTMGPDPNDVEFRLRAFRPRRPAPLERHFELRRSRAPFWVAVAAGVAVALLVGWRVERARRSIEPADNPTLWSLTTLALNDPEEFDAVLAVISRTSLPDVDRPGSAFQQLAKP
jgi:hypothetical protein